MALLDLLPECTAADCDHDGGPNRHLLPKQREFLDSDAKYLAHLGGYGSGKTIAACILCIQLSRVVAGNRGIVVRKSYSNLHDSTERIFLEVLQRYGMAFKTHEMRDGWPHRIILENGSEVFFRETKDEGRLLGPEYGWFYIDEAIEQPERVFKGLQGRLRLPRAAEYLKGIITSNPPNERHWIPRIFGLTPGVHTTRDEDGVTSKYHLIRSTTIENPNLPRAYVADLRASHTPEEVRRILGGEYGFNHEGQPVFTPPFEHSKNVATIRVKPATIIRGWDFGYRHPAVTWHQFYRCAKHKVHWLILDCHTPQHIESEPLADEVLAIHKERYAQVEGTLWKPPVRDIGDTAGAQHNEKGPGPILRLSKKPWGLKFTHRKFPEVEPGLDLIRRALRGRCDCGWATLLVQRGCKPVVDMFAGGYHYPKDRNGAPVDKPRKDGFYDDIADSVRYVGELVYRPALRDPSLLDDLLADQPHHTDNVEEDSYAWMGEAILSR